MIFISLFNMRRAQINSLSAKFGENIINSFSVPEISSSILLGIPNKLERNGLDVRIGTYSFFSCHIVSNKLLASSTTDGSSDIISASKFPLLWRLPNDVKIILEDPSKITFSSRTQNLQWTLLHKYNFTFSPRFVMN